MARLRAQRFSARIALLLVAALCVAVIPPTAIADTAPPDYTYWFGYAMDKIYPTTNSSSAKLASAAPGTMTLSGARAEFEGRQIAIRPTASSLRDIWIAPSNLTATDASGNVSTISSENVSTYKVHYVNITNPSWGYTRKGLEPDPLLPMTLANGERLGWRSGLSADLTRRSATAGKTQPYYVLFRIPRDATPGTYTGTLKITCTGTDGTPAPDLVIPVSLKVYKFSVEKQTIKTAFGLNLQWAAYANSEAHGWLSKNANPPKTRVAETTTFKGDQIGGWMQYMADHRLTPQTMITAWENGSDWAPPADSGDMVARDALLTDFLSSGAATTFDGNRYSYSAAKLPEFGAPSYVKDPFASAANTAKAAQYYRTMTAELAPYLNRTYAYPIDEPTASQRTFVEKYAAFIHKNAPGVKYMVTADPVVMNYKLLKDVDIYTNKLHFFYRDYTTWIKPILNAKKSVWIYSHCTTWQTVVPTYMIDQPLAGSRAQGWLAYDTAAEGLLYFSVSAWRPKVSATTYRDPYADPLSYRTTSGGVPFYGNGDGSLVYPGYYPALGLNVEGAPPVGSLRMEALRDGLEDYEYLKQIKTLYGSSAATTYLRKIIGPLPARVAGVLLFPSWSKTPSAYNAARSDMADKIERYRVRPDRTGAKSRGIR
ncbi:MAG: hypothetical protein CVT66_01015 [Actinobacteria bacterium HGW-Actinobacteria-6]|nr:MAG: hypothetical protein CVT66_01015 [Actinobacteria bacterium HGW-Actinobacteria-6]